MPAFAVPASYVAPTKAKAGDRVDVILRVGNVGTEAGYVAPIILVNGVPVAQTPDYAFVEIGQVGEFSFFFVMPNQAALMEFAAFHWDGAGWVFDMRNSLTILLDTTSPLPSPKYSGLEGSFGAFAAKVSFG